MVRAGHQVLLLADKPGPRFQANCSWHRILPGPQLETLAEAVHEFSPEVIHLHAPDYPESLIRGLASRLGEKLPLLVSTPVFGRPPEDRRVLLLTGTCCVGVFTFYRLGRWLKQPPAEMPAAG